MAAVDNEALAQAVTTMLVALGEDPTREGLAETPSRVAELLGELYAGVGVDPRSVLEQARLVASGEDERGEDSNGWQKPCMYRTAGSAWLAKALYVSNCFRLIGY